MLTGLLYLTLLQGSNFMFNGTENCQILKTQSKPEQLKNKVHGLFKKKKQKSLQTKRTLWMKVSCAYSRFTLTFLLYSKFLRKSVKP